MPLKIRQHYKGKPGPDVALEAALRRWGEILREDHRRPVPFCPSNEELHVTITDGEDTGWLGLT